MILKFPRSDSYLNNLFFLDTCHDATLGNENGNRNTAGDNGNNNGACVGKCTNANLGNNNGNDNTLGGVSGELKTT